MYPKILHIYGPLYINSYGFMIAIGFGLLIYNLYIHPKRKSLISDDAFFNLISWGLIVGIIGGRLLYIIMEPKVFSNNWIEAFFPWEGGFSILGTILSLLIFLPLYLHIHKIKILEFLDLVSIYAPLMQAISRIGCFLAGCCYGKSSIYNLPWLVCYNNPECLAPLGILLHPTQLYSSLASFIIFLLMRYFFQSRLKKAGQMTFTYLMLEGIARFMVDFWRGDWSSSVNIFKYFSGSLNISGYQLICIGLFLISFLGLGWISKNKN